MKTRYVVLATLASVLAVTANATASSTRITAVDCLRVGHPSAGVTVGMQLSGVPRSWCQSLGAKVIAWTGKPTPYPVRCDFLNARIVATASVYSNNAAAGRRFCTLLSNDLLTAAGLASGWKRVF